MTTYWIGLLLMSLGSVWQLVVSIHWRRKAHYWQRQAKRWEATANDWRDAWREDAELRRVDRIRLKGDYT